MPSLPPRRRETAWTSNPAPGDAPAFEDEPTGVEAIHEQLDRLRPLLRRMKRNWVWGLVGLVMAGLLVAGYATLMFSPPYKSETVVFYQPAINPESLGEQAGRIDPTYLHELVFRRGRIEELLSALDLHQNTIAEHGMDAAVEEVKQKIDFDPVGKSTFRLSYIGDTPEQARDVTAWLANQMVQEELGRRRQQAEESKVFLDEELERTTAELAEHEDRLGAFIAKHPRFATTNNEAAREAKLAGGGSTTGAAEGGTEKRYVVRHVRRPTKGKAKPSTSPMPAAAPDPQLVAKRQAALDELTRASQDLARLGHTFTEAHPDYRAAQARVARAENAVSEATDAVNVSTAQQLYAESKPAEPASDDSGSERVAIRVPVPASKPSPRTDEADESPTSTAPTLADLEKLPPEELGDVETQWMRLKRTVDEARDQQARVAAESFRAEVQSRSQAAGHSARAVILDAAYLPTKPMRSRLFFVKLGAPFALLVALTLLIGRAILDDRIHGPEDVTNRRLARMMTVIPPHGRA